MHAFIAQDQVRSEQTDVRQQREQLFRKLEMLTSQGILISPNMPVVTSSGSGLAGTDASDTISHDTDTPPSSGIAVPTPQPTPSPPVRKMETAKWKAAPSKPAAVPLNLISAANQQKVSRVCEKHSVIVHQ